MTRFKADVLNLYRSHVESLSRLPEYAPDAPAEPAAEDENAAAADPAAAEADTEADETEPAAQSEDFWNKDEAELTAPDQKQPAEVDYSAFQGVQFSK